VLTSDAESFNPIELTADIVVAFVASNALRIADLPSLIQSVHAALAQLVSGPVIAAPLVEKKEPAVSIRKSITPDYVVCLDDGKTFKSLRRHLGTLGLTPDEYRAKWSLPADYPMVAPNYAAQRIRTGQAVRAWSDAQECRAAPEGLHRRTGQAWASREGWHVIGAISKAKKAGGERPPPAALVDDMAHLVYHFRIFLIG
jgi:predicted transcriptional regulator